MKSSMRNGLAMASAIIIAGFASQAFAQTAQWCNPVLTAANLPVMSAGGTPVLHAGSYPCPVTAAPVAAPAVQPQYQVFFDWDKSNITPAADRIISDVVAAVGTGQNARIHVIGHTDTSGPPAYNQGLSERRAASIKQALVAKGIPAASITTEGVGETQLLVQTGPNVREPSNRRGQILPRGANMPSS
ncbi:OmpA family protein [Azospirillum sp. ST 5-10]|uniref:OmpA family protein n=1 Tax=unclassified Azospirillum TaxID=2630922 RepID=UPI003F49E044